MGKFRPILAAAAAVAALAIGFSAPAQASVGDHSSTSRATTSVSPQDTWSRTYGPYGSYLACDNQWADVYGSRNLVSITRCTPYTTGWKFTATFVIVTTY